MPTVRCCVLASTSVYRRELLARLGLRLSLLARGRRRPAARRGAGRHRLAAGAAKARAGAAALIPRRIVIGSDQVAELDGTARQARHPGARRQQQLEMLSGRSAISTPRWLLLNTPTGLIAYRPAGADARQFRPLDRSADRRVSAPEQPYDCAGSAKSEGLGIALLESIGGTIPRR